MGKKGLLKKQREFARVQQTRLEAELEECRFQPQIR
jgi:hypothetical protein